MFRLRRSIFLACSHDSFGMVRIGDQAPRSVFCPNFNLGSENGMAEPSERQYALQRQSHPRPSVPRGGFARRSRPIVAGRTTATRARAVAVATACACSLGVGFQVFRLSRGGRITPREEKEAEKGNPDLGNSMKRSQLYKFDRNQSNIKG